MKNLTRKPTRDEQLNSYHAAEDVVASLPIILQTEKLMDELNTLTTGYPRSERYALGSQTRQAVQDFFELLITAAKKYTKKTTLRDADIKFFLLKRLINIALRRHYISVGQYENLILRFLLPIGKQLGGWIQKENL